MISAKPAPSPSRHFRADVLDGLSRPRKRLPAKYFYDAAGSRIFDRITELPEYYPTRTELGILRTHAASMAARCGSECLLVEFGAGGLSKARLLLDQLDRPAGYVPVDISREHLHSAAGVLAECYPSLEVLPVVADFTTHLILPDVPASRCVVYFPGSTLGNFDPPRADFLLRRIARLVGKGGGLLLGVDLRKDTATLERAYNDAAGVSAAFNRNLLARANRELGANFDLAAFSHHAFYNRPKSRIEMHLVSVAEQWVRVGPETFHFHAGESIHTENSYKYAVNELALRAERCGLWLEETWMDDHKQFAVLFLAAA